MKLSNVLILNGFLALIGGCSEAALPPDTETKVSLESAAAAELNKETLHVGLRLDRTITADGLQIRWLHVNDSRCPIGVECFWEGQVTVTLEVRSGSLAAEKVELLLRAGMNNNEATINGNVVSLLGVEPYPRSGHGTARSEYSATIEINAL